LKIFTSNRTAPPVQPEKDRYSKALNAAWGPSTFCLEPEVASIENLRTKSYRFLVSEYQRVLKEGIMGDAISTFRNHFDLTNLYSDQKIIDTLIWKLVPFLESGAVRDGIVMYR
jgi:hypothetical protein